MSAEPQQAEREVDAPSLPLRGQPLHTRTLIVDLSRRDPHEVQVEAQILDLRKCAFVPGAGDLQTAGFIHLMKIRATLGVEDREIRSLSTAQPHVAYEPDPEATAGECCRDPAPRLQELVGSRLDAVFPKRLSALFGGPLGCSHLLTLAQLMGRSLPPMLARELGAGWLAARRDGERIAKRTLVIDGTADGADRMEVGIQQSEFHMRPRERVTAPFERLARWHEVHLHARVDLGPMTFTKLDASERVRSHASLGEEAWTRCSDEVLPFVGGPALRGLSRALFDRLGARSEKAALLDALLNLAPALIQCLAALSGRWIAGSARERQGPATVAAPSQGVMGGFPDSCYMWRRGGAMQRRRDEGRTPLPT